MRQIERLKKDVLVLSRGKNPSLHEESNLRPFDSASQQRLFRWATENSLESEANK